MIREMEISIMPCLVVSSRNNTSQFEVNFVLLGCGTSREDICVHACDQESPSFAA